MIPLLLILVKLLDFDAGGRLHEGLGVLLTAHALRDVHAEILHGRLKILDIRSCKLQDYLDILIQ